MASITASAATAPLARAALAHRAPATGVSAPVFGLPQMRAKGGRIACSSEAERASAGRKGVGGASSLVAAVSVLSVTNPVLALVDERMSTEGTGLSLGLSNNLLGWILLGVFGLIWALYTIYTSTLEDDEESGLSL